MKTGAAYIGLLSAFAAGTTLAANVTVVDQVGPGSIQVQQDGDGNSVEVHQAVETKQSVEDKKSIEKEKSKKPKKAKNPADFQKSVLTSPIYTSRGRARAIIGEQTGKTPALLPDDTTQKSIAPPGNSVRIYQEGNHNRATTTQVGEKNSLNVEQKGDVNELERTQQGKHNRSHVVVNGETIEDQETNEDNK